MLLLSALLLSANLATSYALPNPGPVNSVSTANTTSKRGVPPERFLDHDPDFYPTPPQPTGPTSALSISYDHDFRLEKFNTLDWVFIYTPYGKEVGCNQKFACKVRRDPWSESESFAAFPSGVWHLDLNGEQCTYRNSGNNPGRLFCGNQEFPCFKDPASSLEDKGEYKCSGKTGPLSLLAAAGVTRRPKFTCPYRSTIWI